jgi:HAD superfamily hydrolase (TIGR01509 family)
MISCVIFDCDGTLVDSEYLCNLGLEIKLREYDIDSNAVELMSRFRGAALAFIVEQLETQNDIKFDRNFIPSYRDIVENLFEEKLEPCEGVIEMLDAIQLPICVASSGPKDKIHKALSVTGLLKYFNHNLFSCYDIKSWKPKPDIFIHAAKEMGFSLNRCAVVEDSAIGISAAMSAATVPIYYNPSAIHDLREGAHEISHMSELNDLIRSLC